MIERSVLAAACALATSGCMADFSVGGGAGRSVIAGIQPALDARLGLGAAVGRVRLAGHTAARVLANEGTRWSVDGAAGYAFGSLREHPGALYAFELSALGGVPLRDRLIAENGEFYAGADARLVWWLGQRRAAVDRGRALSIVNWVPQLFVGLRARAQFEVPNPGAGYDVGWDTSLFIGFRYQLMSELLEL